VFQLDFALQGEQGVDLAAAAIAQGLPFAIAFVDMRMPPGWDGLETIEAIWAEYPDLEVVICTAYSDRSDDEIVERLGVTDQLMFLRKPFDPIEVRQLARALTSKWSLRQEARLRLADLERRLAARGRALSAMNDQLTGGAPGTLDLGWAMASAAASLRDRVDLSARLDLDLGDVPPVPCAVADVNQVLLGLLESALEAVERAPARPGRISVATRVESGHAVVAITDSGDPVADAAALFQPFRVASDGERQGLAVARRVVVDEHGGRLVVEDARGGGVTVVVSLPLERS
jgi:signal transduction histidine kinase